MLKTTGSHCIITQSSLEALTSPVKGALEKEGYSVDFVELPAFHDIYPQFGPRNGNGIAAFVPYPPPETPRKGDDLAVFIHSSGSTGLPKSIPWTERVFLLWADSCTSLRHILKRYDIIVTAPHRYHQDVVQVSASLGVHGSSDIPQYRNGWSSIDTSDERTSVCAVYASGARPTHVAESKEHDGYRYCDGLQRYGCRSHLH